MRLQVLGRWMRMALVSVVVVSAFCLSHPSEVHATSFTLSSAVLITGQGGANNLGVTGSIYGVDPYPISAFTSVGNVTNAVDQDWFWFQVMLDPGSWSVDQIGAAVAASPLFGNPVGAGFIVDGGLQGPDAMAVGPGPPTYTLRADYSFGLNTASSANLQGGETSVIMFVTFENSSGGAGALASGNAVTFMISPLAASFSLTGGTIVANSPVPEPGTALLLGGGLLALPFIRRRLVSSRRVL